MCFLDISFKIYLLIHVLVQIDWLVHELFKKNIGTNKLIPSY